MPEAALERERMRSSCATERDHAGAASDPACHA